MSNICRSSKKLLRPLSRSGHASARLKGMTETVFAEFSAACVAIGATNLGQGFPNYPPPDFVTESLKEAAEDGVAGNQYCRSMGHPMLVEQLQKLYSELMGRNLNMMNFVATDGATDGLFTTCQAFIDVGDECIVMEPFYDAYPMDIQMAGGIVKYLPMDFPSKCTSSAQFTLNYQALEDMITDKTKLLFINNPHNPTGKVWSREELTEIANIVKKYPKLLVVADEAYEWLQFDGLEHVRMATIPGMWDKTITICSAGKSFECTGWKIGWVIGPEEITAAFQLAHQWVPFCVSTPLQYGIARSFEKAHEHNWFPQLAQKLQRRRDYLCTNLRAAGLEPIVPQGGYFVCADTSGFDFPIGPGERRDFEFVRWMIRENKLGPIPPSAFYSADHAHMVGNLTRFALCKSDDLIEAGVEKLQAMAEKK